MTFNVVRKADGGLVCQCDSLEEAESRIAAYSHNANLFRIEPDFDMTPRPHPYKITIRDFNSALQKVLNKPKKAKGKKK